MAVFFSRGPGKCGWAGGALEETALQCTLHSQRAWDEAAAAQEWGMGSGESYHPLSPLRLLPSAITRLLCLYGAGADI